MKKDIEDYIYKSCRMWRLRSGDEEIMEGQGYGAGY